MVRPSGRRPAGIIIMCIYIYIYTCIMIITVTIIITTIIILTIIMIILVILNFPRRPAGGEFPAGSPSARLLRYLVHTLSRRPGMSISSLSVAIRINHMISSIVIIIIIIITTATIPCTCVCVCVCVWASCRAAGCARCARAQGPGPEAPALRGAVGGGRAARRWESMASNSGTDKHISVAMPP